MLILDEPEPEVAARFHDGRLAPVEVEAHPLFQRWARSTRLGLGANAAAHPEGTSGADLIERRGRLEDVFREERALLEPIADELAARALLALLADPQGVIVAARGGGAFLDPAGRVRLVEGARWDEETRGTNAIGTSLVEGLPVAVVGRAHFETRNHGLFCYATPIHDAYGDVVAVFDVTGPIERHDATVAVAVQTAGAGLERALRAMTYAATGTGGLAVLERLVDRCATPALLVEADGSVRIVNGAARVALHVSNARGALTSSRVFGLAFEDLSALAITGGRDVRFETRGAQYRAQLDPIIGPRGRPLAVLVHLERESHGHAQAAADRVAPARDLSSRVRAPEPKAARHPAFQAIAANDVNARQAEESAARFAVTKLPVLLLAETGTGKELFARAIHAASPRASGPFVALNCSALAPTLLESEIFGHAPGAFTGASRNGTDGRLAGAHGGTLFLDEIADMPEPLQAMLLRVLDDGTYCRVGETRARKSDFRLVCATWRDLPAMVERGTFRRDLFFRIHGGCVTLPPLRARTDRLHVASVLLARIAPDMGLPVPAIDATASAWILAHDWPGNIRELESALRHALALAEGGPLAAHHFPRPLLRASTLTREAKGEGDRDISQDEPASSRPSESRTRNAILRDAVAEAVRAADGNLSDAARRLGVARSTVYRALERPKT